MKVLVTGANGFIGKNLVAHLNRLPDLEVLAVTRQTPMEVLEEGAASVSMVFHLAGVNRPTQEEEFETINVDFTRKLCELLAAAGTKVPVVCASSIQAELDNPYGRSKLQAEEILLEHGRRTNAPVVVFRLPNVFGKWSRPNYNSVVATFCHNVARRLPLEIHDPARVLRLVYVDDVVGSFMQALQGRILGPFAEVSPVYTISVGELAECLRAFHDSRSTLVIGPVGVGLTRALYATYMSYLPPDEFSYAVPKYGDARGVFVEMLKTRDSGQFSFFTAHPGVTRGTHFHHSKTEKFLVIHGRARFRFHHILSHERFEIETSGSSPEIVETVPGWSHDITNIGDDVMIVMLWANEIFERDRPDTYSHPV